MVVSPQRRVRHGSCEERQDPLVLAEDHGVPTTERDGNVLATGLEHTGTH